MHCDIVVLKSDLDYPCSLTSDEIFERMNGVPDYVEPYSVEDANKCKLNVMQMIGNRIGGKVTVDDEENIVLTLKDIKEIRANYIMKKIKYIENAIKKALDNIYDMLSYYCIKEAVYDEYDTWICTDIFDYPGDFYLFPFDTFVDNLKHLYLNDFKYKSGEEIKLFYDNLFDYHF